MRVLPIGKVALTAALLGIAGPVAAAGCQVRSLPYRVSVLELYTSEGCSSCPPADRWLSALPQRGIDSTKLIALAFHVDYWDQLGWPDRFSQARFSERQRLIADRIGSGVIYTPQLVLDGRDLRMLGGMEKLQKTLASRERPGAQLEVSVEALRSELSVSAHVSVNDTGLRNQAQVWIAVLENGLSSKVARGENAGRELHHDFVVRELAGPFALDTNGQAQVKHAVRTSADWNLANVSIAVFVQRKDNGEYLQATLAPPACTS
jgi:hypothetical protein